MSIDHGTGALTLERPRNKRDEGFDALVDSIFERIV